LNAVNSRKANNPKVLLPTTFYDTENIYWRRHD
jgi:hypothetical protein